MNAIEQNAPAPPLNRELLLPDPPWSNTNNSNKNKNGKINRAKLTLVVTSTFSPFCSNVLIIPTWPYLAAVWMLRAPSWKLLISKVMNKRKGKQTILSISDFFIFNRDRERQIYFMWAMLIGENRETFKY